jgi:hypothetical protein
LLVTLPAGFIRVRRVTITPHALLPAVLAAVEVGFET